MFMHSASVNSIIIIIYVQVFFADFSVLPTHGPCSKYNITDTATGKSFDGKVTLTFEGEPYKVN